MRIGKITGTLVATRKDENLIGCKLMITQPMNSKLEPIGDEVVAIDTVGAGIGEIVIFSAGTAARLAARKLDSPIDIAIVGIVDSMDTGVKE